MSEVYFLRPGNLLMPLASITGLLLKFGSTEDMMERFGQHYRDFGGAVVVDSVVTSNPRKVESELKWWLKMTGRTAVPCKTEKKKTTETEVIVVRDQEDYRIVYEKAKEFSEDYERDLETAMLLKAQLKQAQNAV